MAEAEDISNLKETSTKFFLKHKSLWTPPTIDEST